MLKRSPRPQHREIAALIYIADGLAKQGGIGSPANESIDIASEANRHLNLSEKSIAIVRELALAEFEETKLACSS